MSHRGTEYVTKKYKNKENSNEDEEETKKIHGNKFVCSDFLYNENRYIDVNEMVLPGYCINGSERSTKQKIRQMGTIQSEVDSSNTIF